VGWLTAKNSVTSVGVAVDGALDAPVEGIDELGSVAGNQLQAESRKANTLIARSVCVAQEMVRIRHTVAVGYRYDQSRKLTAA